MQPLPPFSKHHFTPTPFSRMMMSPGVSRTVAREPRLAAAIKDVGLGLGLIHGNATEWQADATAIFQGTKYHQVCHSASPQGIFRGRDKFNIACFLAGNRQDDYHLWIIPDSGGHQYAYDAVIKPGHMAILRGDTMYAELPSTRTRWRWRLFPEGGLTDDTDQLLALQACFRPHPHILPHISFVCDDEAGEVLNLDGTTMDTNGRDLLVFYPHQDYHNHRALIEIEGGAKATKKALAINLLEAPEAGNKPASQSIR
jgi:hypothetical protein